MRIRLYLDEDAMDSDLVSALRLRDVEVTTALEVGLTNSPDEAQLEYAIEHGRTLYSFNVGDFIVLHKSSVATGKHHAGIILARQQRYSVGEQMRRLVRLSKCDPLRVCAMQLNSLAVGVKGKLNQLISIGDREWQVSRRSLTPLKKQQKASCVQTVVKNCWVSIVRPADKKGFIESDVICVSADSYQG